MKVKIERTQWERVRPQLNASQLRSTVTRKNKIILFNFVILLDPPNRYPRLHIISLGPRVDSKPRRKKYVVLKLHVDLTKHGQPDYYHPKIQKVINQLTHS